MVYKIKRGKEEPDKIVEATLYRRAIGYEEDDTKIMQYNGDPVIVPYIKKIQPDITAIIFWLKNRRPDRWRDRQEHEIMIKKIKVTRKKAGEGSDDDPGSGD